MNTVQFLVIDIINPGLDVIVLTWSFPLGGQGLAWVHLLQYLRFSLVLGTGLAVNVVLAGRVKE